MEEDIQAAVAAIAQAQTAALLPQPGSREALLASLALGGYFKETGREAQVISSETWPQEAKPPFNELITPEWGQRQLTISFDYSKAPIEKVDYRVEEESFNLILSPVTGSLQAEEVKVSLDGLTQDLLVVLTVSPGEWPEGPEKGKLSSFKKSLVLGPGSLGEGVGDLRLSFAQPESISYLVFKLLLGMKVIPSPAIARLLLSGLTTNQELPSLK